MTRERKSTHKANRNDAGTYASGTACGTPCKAVSNRELCTVHFVKICALGAVGPVHAESENHLQTLSSQHSCLNGGTSLPLFSQRTSADMVKMIHVFRFFLRCPCK